MADWTAEIINDPNRSHELYVELLERDDYRARLYRDDTGQMQLRVYEGPEAVIPAKWLAAIITQLNEDLRT
jgi:hypothetical protein